MWVVTLLYAVLIYIIWHFPGVQLFALCNSAILWPCKLITSVVNYLPYTLQQQLLCSLYHIKESRCNSHINHFLTVCWYCVSNQGPKIIIIHCKAQDYTGSAFCLSYTIFFGSLNFKLMAPVGLFHMNRVHLRSNDNIFNDFHPQYWKIPFPVYTMQYRLSS